MQKNLQVYIDAVGIDRDIIRAALKPSVKFLGFFARGGYNFDSSKWENL